MPSSLERRLAAIEVRRAAPRSVNDYSDQELLVLMGWTGAVPPTDDELLAFVQAPKKEAQV
jgi:hypothetical protein